MTRYHGKMSPKALLKVIDHFTTMINESDDQVMKESIFNAAYRFAIDEARRNDKFPHQVFMARISERTGVNV